MAIKSNVYVNITDSSIETSSTSVNKSTTTTNVSQMLDDIMASIENKADKIHEHEISQIMEKDNTPFDSVDEDWIDSEWEKE